MHWPSLSIVTPSLHQAEFLETTIRSVLEQRYPHLEYLVMDGGSTDGSVDILRRYQRQLKFVSEPDGSQAAALNQGFRRTSGEIVGWINSDDVYAPGAFETVGRFFAEHPEVQWVYGRCPMIDRQGAIYKQWVTRYKEFWARRYSYRRLLVENFISQPAVFFRRRLFEQIGEIDEQYVCAFDYHLFIRMGQIAAPTFLDRELAYFRSYETNKSSFIYRKSFTEELDAARRVAAGRHPVLMFLHAVNRLKLITAYDLLSRRVRRHAGDGTSTGEIG